MSERLASQLIRKMFVSVVLINGTTVSRIGRREQPGWKRRMEANDRARVAVRFDRQRLHQAVVALFELNALRTLDPVREMAAIARQEIELEAAPGIADAAQRLLPARGSIC